MKLPLNISKKPSDNTYNSYLLGRVSSNLLSLINIYADSSMPIKQKGSHLLDFLAYNPKIRVFIEKLSQNFAISLDSIFEEDNNEKRITQYVDTLQWASLSIFDLFLFEKVRYNDIKYLEKVVDAYKTKKFDFQQLPSQSGTVFQHLMAAYILVYTDEGTWAIDPKKEELLKSFKELLLKDINSLV